MDRQEDSGSGGEADQEEAGCAEGAAQAGVIEQVLLIRGRANRFLSALDERWARQRAA